MSELKKRGQVVRTVEDRLLRKSKPEGDCIEWTGSLRNGYGRLIVGARDDNSRRHVSAHRAAYECWVGQVPAGFYVCHRCDNRRCINPAHLFVGTARENFDDMRDKGRNVLPPQKTGERHASAKLRDSDVQAILADSRSSRRVAHDFGISSSHVRQIRRGLYRKLPPPPKTGEG
jgi:DNA-binding CsgD family transcriptional regulator